MHRTYLHKQGGAIGGRSNLWSKQARRSEQGHGRNSCHLKGPGGRGAGSSPHAVASPASTIAIDYGSWSSQGLREGMEDDLQVLYDPRLKLLYCAIFDGHGGPQAANWLAKELHGFLAKTMSSPTADGEAALTKCFEMGDQALMAHLSKMGQEVLSNAGATGTVALVSDLGRLMVANVGDTEGFVLHKQNEAIPVVTPHRVYGSGKYVQSETARVKATGAWIHDGRVCNILAVSRAFGDWEFKGDGLKTLLQAGVEREYWDQKFADKQRFTGDPVIVTPSYKQLDLTEQDELFVMASDGMWDVVPPAEMLKLARNKFKLGSGAAEVAEYLVNIALKRKTTDNVACIVVNFKGREHWDALQASSGPGNFFGSLFGKK